MYVNFICYWFYVKSYYWNSNRWNNQSIRISKVGKMATTQTKPNIQIDDLVRVMTDEEYANYQAQQAEAASQKAAADAKAAARASALAKLADLGLTAEEIAAL